MPKGGKKVENATKALLIAGGVLIAIIILSVMVIMFQKTGNVTKTYEQTISQEEITKFNSNFTKYIGQELTIHEVVTITNFADIKNNKLVDVIVNGGMTADKIESNLGKKYKLSIPNNAYNEHGYITNILISEK